MRKSRRGRQHLPRAGTQSAAAGRGGDGIESLDAAQRAVGAYSQRARAGGVAVRRPAPDRCDRPLAAARAEAHPARRADGRARRGADRRGARPDRARARSWSRRGDDQP